jgi:hypothetical protein
MTIQRRRTAAALVAGALLVTPLAMLVSAPLASARPAGNVVAKGISLTSAQLTSIGFPTTPNTVAWEPGTASLPTSTAAPWHDVILTGKAPGYAQPGQLLTMQRFVATTTTGTGSFTALNITAVVQANRSFSMHFQLGTPGAFGYRVGYSTGGDSPEFVGFQYQFTTTGTATRGPGGSSTAVPLKAKKLAAAGFTRTPNVVGWGGTAAISTHRAPAGAPVTISGTAPAELKPGTTLILQRFVPTDKKGSGHFESVDSVQTVVAADGSFTLTFEVNQQGRYGYTLGAGLNEEWIGIEFQLKTT